MVRGNFVQSVKQRQDAVRFDPRCGQLGRHIVPLVQLLCEPFLERLPFAGPGREVEHERDGMLRIVPRAGDEVTGKFQQQRGLAGTGRTQDEQAYRRGRRTA